MTGPVSPGQAEDFARAVWAERAEPCLGPGRVVSWVLVAVFAVLAVGCVALAVVLTVTGPPLSGATIAAGALVVLAGLFVWDAQEIARSVL